ncbi:uncharacterized protein [Enoplosus armatus]|uniref:uncharacterized protein n=1 Tax=Enoplosus armatus TaxID=215367 RepID=UPI0039939EA8
MSPPPVRLGNTRIKDHLVELRARFRDIGRDVVVHQLGVRQSKCGDIEKRPENRAKLTLFFGLLGGYIIAITGQRKGVVINMTTEEIHTAEKTKKGARIIRVTKKRKKTEKVSSAEGESEDREPMQDEDNQGFEEEEQESSGAEERVRKRLYQQCRNKMVSSPEEEGVGDTEEDSEEEDEHVAQRTYQLRKKKEFLPLNRQTPKQMESSSEEDGTYNWKPTDDESENDSEEEEEQVRQRVPKVAKNKRVE